VLATVHHSSPDLYHCALTPHAPLAQLPQLAFENATRKTRPLLAPGALVYARVAFAHPHAEPELECVHAGTGRADGLGELRGGMVWRVSLGMARRLMMPDPARQGAVVLLHAFAEKLPFEIAVGRNGRVWVSASGGGSGGSGDDVRRTLAIGNAIVETDRAGLSPDEQRKTVRRLLKGLGL
jgi:exosome complex component RRP40